MAASSRGGAEGVGDLVNDKLLEAGERDEVREQELTKIIGALGLTAELGGAVMAWHRQLYGPSADWRKQAIAEQHHKRSGDLLARVAGAGALLYEIAAGTESAGLTLAAVAESLHGSADLVAASQFPDTAQPLRLLAENTPLLLAVTKELNAAPPVAVAA